MKTKKKPKTVRQKLIKENDDLLREIIRKPCCERCKSIKILQVAHIRSRKLLGIRWNVDNVFWFCYACHFHWAHKEPLEFDSYVLEKKGEKIYWMLKQYKSVPMKLDRIRMINIFLKQTLNKE